MSLKHLNLRGGKRSPSGVGIATGGVAKGVAKGVVLGDEAPNDNLFTEAFLKSSSLYSRHEEINSEVDKHKWYESEKAGRDVGVDYAFFDWLLKHSNQWRSNK